MALFVTGNLQQNTTQRLCSPPRFLAFGSNCEALKALKLRSIGIGTEIKPHFFCIADEEIEEKESGITDIPAMTTHGQSSAPSFQTNHALWTESPDNVPPLFDYELYRQSRSRDASFKFEQTDVAARSSNDQGLSLASMVNSYYESPHDHMGMHRYRNAPTYGNPSVGPPAQMSGGGYDDHFQKAKQQKYRGQKFHEYLRF